MANLPAVKDDTFDKEVLQSQSPVLVDFSATWCGPCKALAPTLEALSTEFSGRMKFVMVDIDDARNIAMRFNIMSVPTMMLFKNGEVVNQVVGARSKAEIASMLNAALGA